MDFLGDQAIAFAELFSGNPNAYGVHIPVNNVKKGEKAKGKSFLERKHITNDTYLKHLHGEKSIGVAPMMLDNTILFGAIDIDVYPLNPVKYISIIKKFNLPLIPCKTKSAGLHLYIFFKEPVKAEKALPFLQEMRQILGLPADTEVFPKQARLVGDSVGNWINIPYFNHQETTRYAYKHDLTPMTLDEFIAKAKIMSVSLKDLESILKEAPYSDGPPCIQTIFACGGAEEGHRNAFLFNCGSYMKAKHEEDFAEHLHELNSGMDSPMKYQELDTTVIASLNRKEYVIQCKDPILSAVCDKKRCYDRKYGINSDELNGLTFEGLKQIKCDNPYYIWTVNGVPMVFYSEKDLLSQNRFRELCLRELLIYPKKMKESAWANCLKRALENVEVEVIEDSGDITITSLWMDKFCEFLSRQLAVKKIQVEDGLIWYEKSKKELMFKAEKLFSFMTGVPTFKDFAASRHRTFLTDAGGRPTKIYTEDKKQIRVFKIRIQTLQKNGYLLSFRDNDPIDKKKHYEEIDFIGEEQY